MVGLRPIYLPTSSAICLNVIGLHLAIPSLCHLSCSSSHGLHLSGANVIFLSPDPLLAHPCPPHTCHTHPYPLHLSVLIPTFITHTILPHMQPQPHTSLHPTCSHNPIPLSHPTAHAPHTCSIHPSLSPTPSTCSRPSFEDVVDRLKNLHAESNGSLCHVGSQRTNRSEVSNVEQCWER